MSRRAVAVFPAVIGETAAPSGYICGVPIELPRADPCPYCEAFAGRLVYPAAARSADTAVLVTAEQRGDPHVLVMPTRHLPTILQLDDRETAVLFTTVARVARAMARCFDVEGIAVWQNNGVFAYQSVPHVHVHVAGTVRPRGTRFGPVDAIGLQERQRIADRLAAALSEEERHDG